MDYGYPTNKEESLDPAILRLLSTMQRSIEEALERLSRIEHRLEKIKSK